jgi:hypothetical protein
MHFAIGAVLAASANAQPKLAVLGSCPVWPIDKLPLTSVVALGDCYLIHVGVFLSGKAAHQSEPPGLPAD